MNTNFLVYLVGYVLVVAGVAYALVAAGVSSTWVTAIVLVLAGLGIIFAFARSQSDEARR